MLDTPNYLRKVRLNGLLSCPTLVIAAYSQSWAFKAPSASTRSSMPVIACSMAAIACLALAAAFALYLLLTQLHRT